MMTLVRETAIQYLKETPIGQNLMTACNQLQHVQEAVLAYTNDDSPDELKQLRVGTVLVVSLLDKLHFGKKIKELDKADWNEIAEKVLDVGILLDGTEYSVRVFTVYANYIDESVKLFNGIDKTKDRSEAISSISKQIRMLGEQMQAGKIKEVDYTEECLWLCLDAMVKLLSCYIGMQLKDDYAELLESVSAFAFEYARYSLYSKELELLDLYTKNLGEMNQELEVKLDAYLKLLNQKKDEFNGYVEDAFSQDLSKRMKASMDIARMTGVDETEVLKDVSDVDDFFG